MSNEAEATVPDTVEAEVETPEVKEIEAEATEATDETTEASNDGEQSDSEPESDTEEKPKKRNNRAEKRIKQLSRKNYELQAKMEAMEQSFAADQAGIDTAPSRDQFDTEDDYIDAQIEHRETIKESQEQRQSSRAKEIEFSSRVQSVVQDAEDIIDNFSDSRFQSLDITQDMSEAIAYSDDGAEIIKHLYSNPDEASRIAGLSPRRQNAAIVNIEDNLNGKSQIKKKSSAPPPMKPVKGSGTSGNGAYRDGMPPAEYAKWHKSNIK